MQYVNETVVEVNVPAVASKLHVKHAGHDSVKTHAPAILFFSRSTSAWAPSRVKDTERRVKTGFSVSAILASKSIHLLLSNRWKDFVFKYSASHSFRVEHGGVGG